MKNQRQYLRYTSVFFKRAFSIGVMAASLLLGNVVFAEADSEYKAIHVRGSLALLPMAQRVAESYMEKVPGSTVVVSGGGTAFGMKSLLDGTADIAMTNGAIPETIRKEIARRGIQFQSHAIAYQAIVPAVHPSNSVADLSFDQLKGIFSGGIVNWRELGGRDLPITVIIEPPSGGIGQAWRDAVIGDEGQYPLNTVVANGPGKARLVATDPSAISFFSVDRLGANIKPLSINAMHATPENVRNGKYPLYISLMLVAEKKSSQAAKQFIKHFIDPAKGLHVSEAIQATVVREP